MDTTNDETTESTAQPPLAGWVRCRCRQCDYRLYLDAATTRCEPGLGGRLYAVDVTGESLACPSCSDCTIQPIDYVPRQSLLMFCRRCEQLNGQERDEWVEREREIDRTANIGRPFEMRHHQPYSFCPRCRSYHTLEPVDDRPLEQAWGI